MLFAFEALSSSSGMYGHHIILWLSLGGVLSGRSTCRTKDVLHSCQGLSLNSFNNLRNKGHFKYYIFGFFVSRVPVVAAVPLLLSSLVSLSELIFLHSFYFYNGKQVRTLQQTHELPG